MEQQDAVLTLNLRTEEAKQEVLDVIFQVTQQVFELDIKKQAKQESKVDTGTNKRSIDTEVAKTPEGVKAELFTQSGYGGYLEVGHMARRTGIGPARYVPGEPYLKPAFDEGIATIPEKIAEELK